jgi:Glycosyltransferase sugar-binding region containing DXD motif
MKGRADDSSVLVLVPCCECVKERERDYVKPAESGCACCFARRRRLISTRLRPGPTLFPRSMVDLWSTRMRRASSVSSPSSSRLPSFSYPLPRRRRRFFFVRLLSLSLAAFSLAGLAYWFLYETQLEIALYRRSWITSTIKSTPPLSATCFADTSKRPVHSPSFVDLSPGLPLRYGSDCYQFAGLIPQAPLPGMNTKQHVIFHTYWRNDLGRIGTRQLVMLESLIASQIHSYNRIIIWSNGKLVSKELDSLTARFPGRIEVRIVDIDELRVGTPIEGSDRTKHIYDRRAWLDGDLVRVLVMWNFGGIWVDMDMIVTRDLSVLTEHEWVEQWDCFGSASLTSSPLLERAFD